MLLQAAQGVPEGQVALLHRRLKEGVEGFLLAE